MDESVKILCVDDEPNVIKALNRLFMDENYEIFTATSGEEGLALLAEQWDIQVVISDYRMPGMNGVEFLKAVYEGWPETIRIVLSGYADTASVVAAINEGQIYKFIGKPWKDEELKDAINEAIEYYGLERKNKELARKLQDTNAELQIHNEALEKLVVDRTAELVYQNQLLRQSQKILEHLPVGVVGIDSSGFIVQGNHRFCEMVGLDLGSVMGQDVPQLFSEDIAKFIQDITIVEHGSGRFAFQGQLCQIMGVLVHGGDNLDWVVLTVDPVTTEESSHSDQSRQPEGKT